ncbi:MAG: NAD-dependent epimerase/dehydratase family protein [Labilithrix sp.]|nr:NAD-dependent epimerase/dehydratase family protein [Labilithrix sp.]
MTIRKALVTGATGHIGSTLCRALCARGVEVVAVVRPTSNRRALEGADVRIVQGDVLALDLLERQARGCDVVFHNAAIFEIHASDPALLHRVAVEGAQNAVTAAARAGARTVLTGSVVAVGFGTRAGELLDESAGAPSLTVPYYRAKVDGERAAEQRAQELEADLVRVLPTLAIGPGDHRVTPSSRFLVDMLRGKGVTFEGGVNVIDVRDVALGMIAAAERGRSGARYILGGENLLLRDFGAIVSQLTGRAVPHTMLPRWAISSIVAGVELFSAFAGKTPSITRAAIHDLYGRYAWYDVTRARTELGLTTRLTVETVEDAARFFRDHGVVPGSTARAEAA